MSDAQDAWLSLPPVSAEKAAPAEDDHDDQDDRADVAHPGPPTSAPAAAATEVADALPPSAVTTTAQEDIRRLDEIEADLAGIDAALQRLDAGTYGTCELCGAALYGGDTPGTDTPDALLLATRCRAHAG